MNEETVNRAAVMTLDDIRQEERIRRIIEELVAGKSKRFVIDKFSEEWSCSRLTMKALINEALVALAEENAPDRETVRTLNYNRLEELIDDCKSVRDKLKTIDLINKTCNVYDTNLNINAGEDTFKFDIGVDMIQ
mgnify:CR=1 FL=1